MSGSNRFEEEALQWDNKLEPVYTSQALFKTLQTKIPDLQDSNAKLTILDLGCGTGLLSQRLATCPGVSKIVGVDTSKGMIEMFNAKRSSQPHGEKMHGLVKLLEDPNDPVLEGQKFDIAVTHLALHHIPVMLPTVKTLAGVLKPGGTVYLSDFEDTGDHSKKFHPQEKHHDVERHGLTRQVIGDLLKDAGLMGVQVETSFALPKTLHNGEKAEFPFLLASGTLKR